MSSPASEAGPSIGTAFLVLSHGAFLGVTVSTTAISVALMITVIVSRSHEFQQLRSLALAWNAASLIVSAWTVYAIAQTWRTAKMFQYKVFDDFGFSFLTVVTVVIASFNLWTLSINVMDFAQRRRKPGAASVVLGGAQQPVVLDPLVDWAAADQVDSNHRHHSASDSDHCGSSNSQISKSSSDGSASLRQRPRTDESWPAVHSDASLATLSYRIRT